MAKFYIFELYIYHFRSIRFAVHIITSNTNANNFVKPRNIFIFQPINYAINYKYN